MRLAIALCLALAACGAEQGYPPSYELNFMQACQAQGASSAVCACAWARVEAEVPRRDLDALEHLPAAERPAYPVQKQLETFGVQCAAEHISP
jgi:hypothetical protein